MKTIGLFIIIILFTGLCSYSQTDKKEKKAREQLEMAQLIESGQFRFVARSATSNLGTFNNLSANYDMIFDSLTIKAFLPYFGRAYMAQYGSNEGGVKFNRKVEKIERTYTGRKKIYTLTTEVKEPNETYSIIMSIGLNGYADLKISFINRQWISYYGRIEKLEKIKE